MFTCLLINNDLEEQTIFKKALHDVSPHTICFTAADGLDGFCMMMDKNVIPDYIFIELDMPEMDGIGFLREIKAIDLLKDIPVIVHAVSPLPHKVIEMKEAGAEAIYMQRYNYTGICNMLNVYMNMIYVNLSPN